MELASYHASGAMNYEKAPTFLENLCDSALSAGLTRLIHPTTLNCDMLFRRVRKIAKNVY